MVHGIETVFNATGSLFPGPPPPSGSISLCDFFAIWNSWSLVVSDVDDAADVIGGAVVLVFAMMSAIVLPKMIVTAVALLVLAVEALLMDATGLWEESLGNYLQATLLFSGSVIIGALGFAGALNTENFADGEKIVDRASQFNGLAQKLDGVSALVGAVALGYDITHFTNTCM